VKKALRPAFFLFLTATATLVAAGQTQTESQPSSSGAAAAQLPRKLAVVVIDPAHGGSDTGARGSGGTIESEAVVDFGRAIRVALEAQGFRAVLSREGNQNPSLDDRAALANGFSDAIFVTLHVASTGTPGTARVYFCSILPAIPPASSPPGRPPAPPRASRPHGLLEWDRAQEPFLALSRRLALLVQIQLAQHFRGSPETPSEAPIRQLRTVAAPAIAIEISSVSLDAADLGQMGQPLGEALARAASAFQLALTEDAPAQDSAPGSPR
jgi:N-acetylmuramoyl-L-alanine amidase